MKLRITVVGCLILAACNQSTPADTAEASPERNAASPPERAVSLSDADLLRVCRGGASFRNGTDVGRIQARKSSENMVRLSYTRDDGKFFAYDCMTEGNQVRYRMIDEAGPGTGPGTWSGRGSKTTFKLFPDEIEFTDDFFDGSMDTDRITI